MHPSDAIHAAKSRKLQGKKIVLGVTGSIAAVETVKLVRELLRHGAEVYTVMSKSAQSILHPYALEFASGRKPITEIDGSVQHVALCGEGHAAHLFLIAPSTANTISKMACGIDDTPVTTFASAAMGSRLPIIVAPAMDRSMYNHPVVKENMEKLKRLGVEFIEPKQEEEKAKLADIEEIVARVIRRLGPGDMSNKRVVVIAGATQEAIDDVRIVTNRSTGRTGIELAKNAYERGANVELWMGRCEESIPPYVVTRRFETTAELMDMASSIQCDICAVPAAISDYAPTKTEGKIPSNMKMLNIELRPTPKVIDTIRKKSDCFLIGFKAESRVSKHVLAEKALERLKSGDIDLMVANDITRVDRERAEILIVDKEGRKEEVEGPKWYVAERMWSAVLHASKG